MVAVTIAASVASLVCFVIVLVKMFQSGDTGLGIACAVLTLCAIGPLIAFIMGWVNVEKYHIKNVMLIWTVLVVVNIIMNFVAPIPIPIQGQ